MLFDFGDFKRLENYILNTTPMASRNHVFSSSLAVMTKRIIHRKKKTQKARFASLDMDTSKFFWPVTRSFRSRRSLYL